MTDEEFHSHLIHKGLQSTGPIADEAKRRLKAAMSGRLPRAHPAPPENEIRTGTLTVSRVLAFNGMLISLKVFVDDRQMGEVRPGGSVSLELTAGQHSLRVGAWGYHSTTTTVQVPDGGTVRYETSLNFWGTIVASQ